MVEKEKKCAIIIVMKTIVALSTPLGKGAIAIVRMSGEKALEIAQKVFSCKGEIKPRYMMLGSFCIDEVKEKCLMVYFKAPFSFTGEDMVEFQIHGGVTVARLVEERLIKEGAVLAEPGEFSRRAFENGKISLDEAESIVDEINSESEAELKVSLSSASGKLVGNIKEIQNSLTELLAEIEVSMDYPEEDEYEDVRGKIFDVLGESLNRLNGLIQVANEARFIRSGVNVALVGKTNAGKSSLLNALLGEERAIVTSTEGTTRDVIEAKSDIDGVRFNFYDTAGIRESRNKIEMLGIERSKKTLNESDLVLLVVDGSEKEVDDEILKLINKPFITVVNKSDKKRVLKTMPNEIEVSALKNKNIDILKRKMYDMVIKKKIDFNGVVVSNERQLGHLIDAAKEIKEIFEKKNESLEILSMLIKKVWNELGKITGETENEDIIALIFSKFCVGK